VSPAPAHYDLLVVGGGIQGVCLARDAAGRGLRVLLVERGDLAGETSSASSKLIHGGLRYLEQGALRLVRESLREREVLLRGARHLVRPLRFVLPCTPWTRPRWQLRLGLWAYDHLGGAGSLEPSEAVDLHASPYGRGLLPALRHGFVYGDCATDDARLVVSVARAAAELGAVVRTRTECLGAERDGERWRVELRERPAGARLPARLDEVSARVLVNATGPWAAAFREQLLPGEGRVGLRLVQGSHIVLPRLLPGDHALTLTGEDGRVVFVLPWGSAHSLVGTTELALPAGAAPGAPAPTPGEIDYLCRAVACALQDPPTPADVVGSFAGIRPLVDDGRGDAHATSREDVLELLAGPGDAPLLSVFGGKLTTARRVAERCLERLAPWLRTTRGPWTRHAPLPGGATDPAAVRRELIARGTGLPSTTLDALVARHGDRALQLVDRPGGLGDELAPGLHEGEVAHMVEHEWARSADDVLLRRSRVGLLADIRQRAAVAGCVASRLASQRSSPRRAGLGSR